MAQAEDIHVAVAYSGKSRQSALLELTVVAGCTAGQAVRQSQLLTGMSDTEVDGLTLGIRGRKISPNHVLLNNDRVEICRALKVDPKVARRQRFVRQGAKSAGLFTQRRPGAKAGY